MKKSIVLFSRCELVHLYGRLDRYLYSHMNIIHIAYSNYEEKILKEEYNIKNVINFKKEVKKLHLSTLYDPKLCDYLDQLIIKYTNGRFCLNSAIQSDRTFQHLSYTDSQIMCQIYYVFWEKLVRLKKIDLIIHEPTALFFTQIASIVCKMHGSRYLSQVQVNGESKFNWIFLEGDEGFPLEIKSNLLKPLVLPQDISRVQIFLDKFRSDNEVFFSEYLVLSKNNFRIIRLFIYIVKLFAVKFRLSLRKRMFFSKVDHVEIFLKEYSQNIFDKTINKINRLYNLHYDIYDSKQHYYYYPLHLEPEAVVLYYGDGIYKNQVKLIENIAAQLPPNCYLYVKDHPHGGEYRDFIDYKRIKSIVNVKLINPLESGKMIISNSIGVITINGTSGFEALLMNKQVYVFGNSYYNLCKRVVIIHNIKELRSLLYKNYMNKYTDDDTLYQFVWAYLNSVHNGFTDYFSDFSKRLKIDNERNAITVAKEILFFINN